MEVSADLAEEPPVGAEPGVISRQSAEAFRRFSFPGFLARAVHTWKYGALFPLPSYLAVTRPVSGCCIWNTEIGILREILQQQQQ